MRIRFMLLDVIDLRESNVSMCTCTLCIAIFTIYLFHIELSSAEMWPCTCM